MPNFHKVLQDDIPNVKFSVSQIIMQLKQKPTKNCFNDNSQSGLKSAAEKILKEMTNDPDIDVAYFARKALEF